MAGYLDHPWNVVIWQDGIELLLAELARLPEALAPKAAQMLVPELGMVSGGEGCLEDHPSRCKWLITVGKSLKYPVKSSYKWWK